MYTCETCNAFFPEGNSCPIHSGKPTKECKQKEQKSLHLKEDINSILQEADKLFGDEFMKQYKNGFKYEKLLKIIHSQIEKAYKAGQESKVLDYNLESLLAESFRSGTGIGKKQTLKQIDSWIEENYPNKKGRKSNYFSDEITIKKEDLKKFINTL